MQLLSINVGLPQELTWQGETVTTAIQKNPVDGAVMLRRLSLDGDAQVNKKFHGGLTKAVYGYSQVHYKYWIEELNLETTRPGLFGENLTIDELDESEIQIGDQFQIGEAIIMATEPRKPCDVFAMHMQRPDIIKKFLFSKKSGVYFSVVQEGMIEAGAEIKPIHKASHGITISDIIRLDVIDTKDKEGMQRAIDIEVLPQKWKDRFGGRLKSL